MTSKVLIAAPTAKEAATFAKYKNILKWNYVPHDSKLDGYGVGTTLYIYKYRSLLLYRYHLYARAFLAGIAVILYPSITTLHLDNISLDFKFTNCGVFVDLWKDPF